MRKIKTDLALRIERFGCLAINDLAQYSVAICVERLKLCLMLFRSSDYARLSAELKNP